ncbi:MAG: adenosylmethionine decarboxylase [Planctomycetes bacterium]|nr:adenosylmethionine decarboxylase [Planctomycetota bacterium]
MNPGQTCVVDAFGCSPERLRSRDALDSLFSEIVRELSLRPLASPAWHVFPAPGGITGFLLLSESHLSCHTFPENGFVAFDLYCCRALPPWPWEERLRAALGATRVEIKQFSRGGRES